MYIRNWKFYINEGNRMGYDGVFKFKRKEKGKLENRDAKKKPRYEIIKQNKESNLFQNRSHLIMLLSSK